MFVTLQGENYTANFYLFLVIYPLNHEENSEKFERQFQWFFSNLARQLEVPLICICLKWQPHQTISSPTGTIMKPRDLSQNRSLLPLAFGEK